MSEALPALRPLEAALVEHEERPHICLSDPSGLVEGDLLLSPHAYLLAASLDGVRDMDAVRATFAEHAGGQQVAEEQVHQIIAALDEAGFLLTPRFHALREEIVRAYHEAPSRPACFASRSYPEDPATLRAFLDRFFSDGDGPGPLPDTHGGDAPPVRALVVPHIDFHRGAYAYAHGYKRLYEGGKPDTVIVFGVAHLAPPVPFVLTRKDFATPFGVLKTNQEVVDTLAAACAWDPFEHELTHRGEHSIEFQAVMLGYLYGEDVQVVPVLCAAMDEDPEDGRDGGVSDAVERVLACCRELTRDPARRITVIAGADLAHVGLRFGDEFDIDDTVLEATTSRDHEDLAHVLAGSAQQWRASVLKDGNQRRVCGLNCIYATLRATEGRDGAGELLHYGYAPDPAGGIVSFASIRLS